jgi:preprotein translocase subunit SecG
MSRGASNDMATSSPKSSNLLGRRSILARLGAVLALVACGIAIYFLVMNFSDGSESDKQKSKPKDRSEQTRDSDATEPSASASSVSLLLSRS